jgi:hypothetical protein
MKPKLVKYTILMTIISVACALKIIMIYMVNFTHIKNDKYHFKI